MINMLGHHVNKPVLVSIPSLFKDDEPRTCILIGTEPAGVWLESDDLIEAIWPRRERRAETKVFVPFAQIAYLVGDTATSPVPDPDARGGPHEPRASDPAKPHGTAREAAAKKKHR